MGWREQYYEDGYLRRWRLGPPSQAQLDEAARLLSLSGAHGTPRALDLGCGHGRYAIGLARAGARVVGLDASRALLSRAIKLGAELHEGLLWVRADMRAIPFQCAFDFVLVVDAFGYFDEDVEGHTILGEVYRVLRRGGCVTMRNPNATPIREGFRPHDEELHGGARTVIRRVLGPKGHTVHERISVDDGDGTRVFERRARIYSATELESVLCRSGFAVEGHYSTPSGERFDAESSSRMITIARKAG